MWNFHASTVTLKNLRSFVSEYTSDLVVKSVFYVLIKWLNVWS